MNTGCPHKQGLYDPRFEKDACGTGFVVDIQGRKSHAIVSQALQALDNLRHRGACGCEENTGDGAGILIQIPHTFLSQNVKKSGFSLPSLGEYGVGMAFLPKTAADQKECQKRVEAIVAEEGLKFLGWRDVPTNNSMIGESAKATPSQSD
jgi:glutamate synthase (ferredoxin)